MRLSIGLKIFSIAVFLAAVMIAASVLSELRIRRAETRIDVLADYLLPLTEQAGELRAIAFREEARFRKMAAAPPTDGGDTDADHRSAFAKHAADFADKANAMRANVDAALDRMSDVDRKLSLSDIKARLELLVAAHDGLQRLVQRILSHRAGGQPSTEAELLEVFEAENRAFEAADGELSREIRALADAVSISAEADEASTIVYVHIVTAIAAILGLLLAGIMARALVQPISNLRRASMAVQAGDLDQQLPVSGHDEIADLTSSFNTMVEQLRQKDRIEAVFGRYVDPRVVQELISKTGGDTENVAAAVKQEATILFSDIAGYTSISEQLTPSALVRLMNEYFNQASRPISETGGVLDKFIGDAVMAFWCPPFAPDGEIACLACAAALAETKMAKEFQSQIPEITGLRVGAPEIDVRIGLATGDVVVGSIGSPNKRNFTVIGDTVNLCSRLESANKFYGTRILICDRTRELIGDRFAVRMIDRLAVVGKTEAVTIFELISEGPIPPETAAAFDTYAKGLDNYRLANWDEAEKSFRACLDAKPDDRPAKAFLDRIKRLRENPPPEDWDGVWHYSEK